MRGLKYFFLVLFTIILVAGGWVYLATISAENTVLSTDYYQNLFHETDLISKTHAELLAALPDIVLTQIAASMDQKTTDELKEEHHLLFTLAIPALVSAIDPIWLENMLLLVIDDILALVKGEQKILTVVIPLETVKINFYEEIIDRIRAMSRDERQEIGFVPVLTETMANQIVSELGLPDQISLAQLHTDANLFVETEKALSLIQLYRPMFLYLPYLFFGLFLLILILLAKPPEGLKWFGAAVLFFSLSFFIFIQLLGLALPAQIPDGIQVANIPLSIDLIQTVSNYTIARISMITLISSAVGLTFFVAGVIYKRISLKEKPACK